MRIGVDAREVGGRPTGVGRYLSGLLRQWAATDRTRAHEFVLYAAEPITMPLDARRFATRVVAGAPGTWWEQVRVPAVAARDHLDVWFAPAYTAPLRLAVPIVVTIHDLSFVAHPEWFTLREGVRRRFITRHTARRARAIITVSDVSRDEIGDRLGVPAGAIHVIPQGIGEIVDGLEPHRTASDPRLLYSGSIFNRRHVPDLIRAFAALARRYLAASLDLVGDDRSFPAENIADLIERQELGDRLRWHRYASEDQLRTLYARARAFAFLSEYEGLGMTPLEALAAGVPPVLADTKVARASCGDAALYVPIGDIPAATAALEQALFDEPTRARILDSAAAVLPRYQWPRAAAETLAVIEAAGRTA
ncbi:MAG: glycosyltransferase family 4 protein [Betaproteobacteria bacterium]